MVEKKNVRLHKISNAGRMSYVKRQVSRLTESFRRHDTRKNPIRTLYYYFTIYYTIVSFFYLKLWNQKWFPDTEQYNYTHLLFKHVAVITMRMLRVLFFKCLEEKKLIANPVTKQNCACNNIACIGPDRSPFISTVWMFEVLPPETA